MIMLVENNEEDMKNLHKYVMQYYPGMKIVSFNNPRQALDYIQLSSSDIKLCFTAVVMPEVSGFGIAKELRSKNKTSKLVFVSDSPDYAIDAWQYGVNDFLIKPVTEEKIKHTIRSCAPIL